MLRRRGAHGSTVRGNDAMRQSFDLTLVSRVMVSSKLTEAWAPTEAIWQCRPNSVRCGRMVPFRAVRIICLAMTLAAGVLGPDFHVSEAHADEGSDLSRARALFQQGTELEQAGNYAAALLVFREVGQVRMTSQVRFHIASCEEKLGRLVGALGGFELALEEAGSVGPEFQQELDGRIEALRPRIPKLVIERGPGAQAATIELDGVQLGSSSIGSEVPLDPGPHTIVATASGYKPIRSTIEVAEREVKRVTLELEEVHVAPFPVPAPSKPIAEATTPPENDRTTSAPGRYRVVPYVLGGVGVAAFANAGLFYLLRWSKDADLKELCGSDRNCTNANPRPLVGDEVARSRDMHDQLMTYSTVMWLSAATGILAIGAAGTWIVAGPKQQKPSTAWTVHPAAPGAELGGLSVMANF